MSSRFRPFRVRAKVRESANITSFHLEPADGEPAWQALPGQYLTLRLPLEDGPLLRTYSVSGDTADARSMRISVKREDPPPASPDAPPGRGSCWLHDHAVEGTLLEVAAPRGRFVLDRQSARPVVLLCGGVGQTPLLSMLHALANGERDVWYLHACENGEVHALGSEVEALIARGKGRLHHHVVYRSSTRRTDPATGLAEATSVTVHGHDDRPATARCTYGLIDKTLLQSLLPLDDYDCYLCGPPAFMAALYRLLIELGVPDARIAHEFFGKAKSLAQLVAEAKATEAASGTATIDSIRADARPAPGSHAPAALAALFNLTDPGARATPDEAPPIVRAPTAPPSRVRASHDEQAVGQAIEPADAERDPEIVFARAGISARWSDQAGTLLELAEAAGLSPDFSCRSGICNTCLCTLREGDVEYLEEPLTAPGPGKVLICCSRPLGRVVLDL